MRDLTEVVLKTPYGRWLWWPALNELQYRRSGTREAFATIYLTGLHNTRHGAYVRAVRAEDKFTRTGYRPGSTL